MARSLLMWENDCGCVPVVDAGRRVVGMITDRDVCMAAYMRGQPLQELPIQQSMSHQVHACRPDDDVIAAETMMQRAQLRRLPVIDTAGRVVGILSLNDIARAAERPQRDRATAVSFDEVAHTLGALCRPRRGAPSTTAS